jgi:formylglycine-generating enzyme required for sulfatase activity
MKVHIPETIRLNGGQFVMGSSDAGYESEYPPHQLVVEPFCMGVFPVTLQEFRDYCQSNPTGTASTLAGLPEDDSPHERHVERLPATHVSWMAALDYCRWLATTTDQAFRLPTEAEWEFAARANRSLDYPTATGKLAEGLANFDGRIGTTTPVGSFPPNSFGLHDMAGNVWEWCSSKKGDYVAGYCTRSYRYPYDPDDGREDLKLGASRVLRGGCYDSAAVYCRSAARYREFEHRGSNRPRRGGINIFGFRVACSVC